MISATRASAMARKQGLDMLRQVRPWATTATSSFPDRVSLSAVVGKGRGIVREDASDPGLERFQKFVRGVHGIALPWTPSREQGVSRVRATPRSWRGP